MVGWRGVSVGSLVVVAVFTGFSYLLAGLASAVLEGWLHAALMGLGAAFAFPTIVCGIGFPCSLAGGHPRRGPEALLILTGFSAALASSPAMIYSPRVGYLVASACLALVAVNAAYQVLVKGGRSLHWALALATPPAAGSLASLTSALRGDPPLYYLMVVGAVYVAPLMSAVAYLTTSRIYGVMPGDALRALPALMALLVLAPHLAYKPSLVTALSAVQMACHVVLLGFYKAPITALKGGGVGGFIASLHTTALAASVMAAYYAVTADSLLFIHALYMGFVAGHVLVNSLLMQPLPGRRRFTRLPGALLLLSLAIRPLHGTLSLALMSLTVASVLASHGRPGKVVIG